MSNKQHIVIIGANFAGLSAASKLSKSLGDSVNKQYQVTVIDKNDKFQWTPNIHEILSDVKKDSALSLDLKTVMSRLHYDFLQATVSKLDTQAQTITLENEQEVSYDILLVATGHIRNSYGIAGADEHALSIRSAEDAKKIHHKLAAILASNKQTININIIGGGFSGVEVMGEILRKHANTKSIHINIIESKDRLLGGLPEKLSQDVVKQCENYQVNFYFEKQIKELTQDAITFDDGSTLSSDMSIWSAGTKVPDYVQALASPTNPSGILALDTLQTAAFDNVFVAGDAVALSKSVPKQASHAIDMGLLAGSNIARYCRQESLRAFSPKNKPILLSLGDINTYLIQGNLVLASPILATAKEAVYQFWMAHLSSLLPIGEGVSGIASRIALSSEKLLLAEILKMRPRILIGRSKLL